MPCVSGENLEVSLIPNKTVHQAWSLSPDSLRVADAYFEGRVWNVGAVEVHIHQVPAEI